MKKDYSKYIGYILFTITLIVTLIGWGVSYGKLSSELEATKTTVDQVYQMMLEQKELNGKIIMYIELNEKE